jgi:hypothetical protein
MHVGRIGDALVSWTTSFATHLLYKVGIEDGEIRNKRAKEKRAEAADGRRNQQAMRLCCASDAKHPFRSPFTTPMLDEREVKAYGAD